MYAVYVCLLFVCEWCASVVLSVCRSQRYFYSDQYEQIVKTQISRRYLKVDLFFAELLEEQYSDAAAWTLATLLGERRLLTRHHPRLRYHIPPLGATPRSPLLYDLVLPACVRLVFCPRLCFKCVF